VIVGDGTDATVTLTNVFGRVLPATGADSLRTVRHALQGIGIGALLLLVCAAVGTAAPAPDDPQPGRTRLARSRPADEVAYGPPM